MRADAQRNRERIIEVARQLFFVRGRDVPLDDIARAAKVGPGTLYRHFPTRDDLIDACMGAWDDDVATALDAALTPGSDPEGVLRRWVTSYVGLISYFPGSAQSLTAAIGDENSPFAVKCDSLVHAWDRVLRHLDDAGGRRSGPEPAVAARVVGAIAAIIDAARLEVADSGPLLEVAVRGLLAQPPD